MNLKYIFKITYIKSKDCLFQMSKDPLGQYKAVLILLIATVLAFHRLAQFGITT